MPPTRPPLDTSLSAPCKPLQVPDTYDFDVLLDWVKYKVFRDYGECAVRVNRLVEAWQK